MMMVTTILCLALAGIGSCLADGPADNQPDQVRPVPPPGLLLPAETAEQLSTRAQAIDEQLAGLPELDPQSQALISVFPRAVRMTLKTQMFYNEQQIKQAGILLDEAHRRLDAARSGRRSAELLGISEVEPGKPQLLAGGYRSQIDGSVQPYGLVLPADWQTARAAPLKLDVWLHGRGENVSEVNFLGQRLQSAGEFTPPGTLVLHAFGRYCNAFKFAGEVDVLEAIDSVRQLFDIDASRMTIRGFSMGGAGCWQLAVHYPNLWAAANPGAGFCETTEFLRFFQQEEFQPTPTQQLLLRWYDCPGWTNNLRNVPTVAYSGELDRQKQAADLMQQAFASRKMPFTHIIGPDTAHKIHADSKIEIQDFLDAALANGKPTLPSHVDLTTYMLRYHQLGWLSIEGLTEHWQESRVQGQLTSDAIELETQNVTHLRLQFERQRPFEVGKQVRLSVDASAKTLTVPDQEVWDVFCTADASGWRFDTSAENQLLRKRPGLQGPIDDAFMGPFVFVAPDSQAEGAVEKWVQAEYRHATDAWVRHFRGDVLEKRPADVTPALMASHHLILFGTPETNSLIARVVQALPLTWDGDFVQLGSKKYDASHHVPLLIYPNPLNPQRYVVINSGVTYREYAYLNNARQIPMLGDWAVIDISQTANSQTPGRIASEGLFNEQWQLKAD